jgi:hypothetical protein
VDGDGVDAYAGHIGGLVVWYKCLSTCGSSIVELPMSYRMQYLLISYRAREYLVYRFKYKSTHIEVIRCRICFVGTGEIRGE